MSGKRDEKRSGDTGKGGTGDRMTTGTTVVTTISLVDIPGYSDIESGLETSPEVTDEKVVIPETPLR